MHERIVRPARRRYLGSLITAGPLLSLVVIGCSETVTDPVPLGDPVEEALVTPAGGTLEFLGGAVSMTLPAGAVTGDVTISVETVSSGVPSNGVPGGVFRFGPAGLRFAEPPVLSVTYPTAALPEGVDPAWLRLFDFTSGEPELLVGSLHDAATSTVDARIEHFSDYGAGEATPEMLVEVVNQLYGQIDQGQVMVVDRLRESLERDIALTAPVLDSMCVATNVLARKVGFVNQLLEFQRIEDDFGFESVSAGPCGGILDGDDTQLIITPQLSRMTPESEQRFTATMVGPGGQVLEGPIRWGTDDPSVLSVDSLSGAVTALEPGSAFLIAQSPELRDSFTGSLWLLVFDELEVVLDPSPIEVAFNGFVDVEAVILNARTGDEQDGVSAVFEIGDTDVADFGCCPPAGSERVRGESVGTTTLQVCARIPDSEDDPEFCSSTTIEVIPSVAGSWSFAETLTVDVDAPATEVCTTDGTAQISQIGRTYLGTTTATVVCTYDPMDGTEPEVIETVVSGSLRNGLVTGTDFYHEVFYAGEACRSSGTLVIGPFGENMFHSGSGTTECLDDEDYYSVGPIRVARPG